MRDLPNQELISAYLDGELTVDERQEVERLLADSVDCRQYLDQLRRQREAIRGIPRPKLTVDLSQRVLRALEESRAVPQPVAGRPGGSWRRIGWGMAVAGGVAAAVLVAVYLAAPRPGVGPAPRDLAGQGQVPVLPQPSDRSVVPEGPGQPTSPGHSGLPESPGVDEPLPAETQLALQQFQQLVQLVVIYDFTVTLEGQRERLVPNWMAKNGIPVQKGILIDRQLEQAILQARFIGDNRIAVAANGQGGGSDVEMLFVRGTLKQLDGIYRDYLTVRARPNPSVRFRMDLAMAPRELNIFLQLNRATGLEVASMRGDPRLLRTASAFPLQFANALLSVSAATPAAADSLAMQGDWGSSAGGAPVVRQAARLVDAETYLALADPALALVQVAQDGVEGRGPRDLSPLAGGNDPDQPGQAIVIIRSERAGAAR